MAKAANKGALRLANARREPVQIEENELTSPQSILLLALERGNILEVHKVLSRISTSKRKSALLAPSKRPEHQLRTPLMAAAASGDLVIFGTVLEGVNRLFRGKIGIQDEKTKSQLKRDRDLAMQTQMQLVDVGGANLLMIAASTASIAVFNAVTREIRPSQARKLLTKQDVRGMTYLMYAVNPDAMSIRPSLEASNLLTIEEGVPNKLRCQSCTPTHTVSPLIVSSASGGGEYADAAHSVVTQDFELEAFAASPWVPIVKRVLEHARQRLCLPKYLELLQVKDSWDRSIIEHSIVSGRHAVFDTVFEIIRQDVYDEEIERIMEVGEDNEYEQTAMRVALNSEGGKKIQDLVRGKINHLKKDVGFRAESSTVTSKIQAFIPGNLIVIFHLLLPEIREDSHAPLVLLVLLCCIAPFWAWGASLVTKMHPERQNSLARVTWARHMLACPSMFFWGLGTSTIGQYSFGWNESMSAAALAVATVIIPAIDSFAAGTGARAFYGTIYIKVLSLYDEVNKKLQSWFKTKETSWLFDDDDEWQIRSSYPSSAVDTEEMGHNLEAPAIDRAEPKAAVARARASMSSGNTQRLPYAVEAGQEHKPPEAADHPSTHL